MKNNKTGKAGIGFWTVTSLIFLLDVVLIVAINYLQTEFIVSFNQIYATLLLPMEGADTGFIGEAVLDNAWKIAYFLLPTCFFVIIDLVVLRKINGSFEITLGKRIKQISYRKLFHAGTLISVIALLLAILLSFEHSYNVIHFFKTKNERSTIYEEYYVDPNSVNITAGENAKNVIYIYVESLETTYASESVGGNQPVNNYIPNLTEIARENISFSNTDKLGGFQAFNPTSYTFGALIGSTFGFPLSAESIGIDYSNSKILPEAVNFGDVLEKNGYNQEFLCGSDASFAGRDNLFKSHGNYKIFDYFTAIEKGYIDENYKVWWGFEDAKLFEIAKDEITALAAEEKPFNFTMLTVDTHHIDGYVCQLCEDTYPEQVANVIACTDRQMNEFINWIKEQDFYEDTLVVIVGDHPRMDSSLVNHVAYENRMVYNCFINSDKYPAGATVNRKFSIIDMFPTVLSAMGFEIEGDRLGLGTDMFSGKPTILETMGSQKFSDEISKQSDYYEKHLNN